MSHAAPAVALLFDDVELGEQLRVALNERGARIVHEGGIATLTRELLEHVGAQVLVVNLDDSADDALDHLYEVIDGGKPRVVFNDAEASRSLTGWDRARWARHLALKVLEMGDVDPPRPEDARVVENAPLKPVDASSVNDSGLGESCDPPSEIEQPIDAVANAEAAASGVEAEVEPAVEYGEAFNAEHDVSSDAMIEADKDFTIVSESPSFALDETTQANAEESHGQSASEESENLAAELEALLAAGEPLEEEEVPIGSGLRFSEDEELPPLHDGHFGPTVDAEAERNARSVSDREQANTDVVTEASPVSVTPPVFQLGHLELAPMNDALFATIPTASLEQVPADAAAAKAQAPSNWALLDEDDQAAAAVSVPDDKAAPADFGIHKLSAAEFLAPDADPADADDELVMSLQLISMEEAIAPKAYEDAETVRANSLQQIVLLGAAVGSTDAVCSFLAALPVKTTLAFVHTQHLGGMTVETLVDTLATHSTLPVRVAKQGSNARKGEILVVPSGQQLRLVRDGSVELMPFGINASQGPSIDASFSMAANVFGPDALAIVFSGRGTDAVAGAQAVHDRGGQVWVESAAGEHYADMVSGISAERLVSFSGTPHELAAHLIEVFP
jgi:chemosensory pili system protein ChpB (putative protein-glutamate methylesterase)